MEIALHLFKKRYSEKPKQSEMFFIGSNIIKEKHIVTVEELAREAGKKGRPFTCALFENVQRETKFVLQQIVALIFEKELKYFDFMLRAEEYEVMPAFVYGRSDCSNEFCAVFVNNCVIEEQRASEILSRLLLYIFPEADIKILDPANIILGGTELLYKNTASTINLKDVAISLQAYIAQKDPHNYSRNIQKISKKLGIAIIDQMLGIFDVEKNEEDKTFTNNIMVGIPNSSFYYEIFLDATTQAVIKTKKKKKLLQKKSCQELRVACPLFNDLFEMQDIEHEQKVLLLTNLIYIKGGENFFFNGLKTHYEYWKKQWMYIKKRQNDPKNCTSGGCPYVSRCQCNSLIEKLRKRVQILKAEEAYISLEEAGTKLEYALRSALESSGEGIYLISAHIALGKTTAYCKQVRERENGRPIMIVVPTIKLQEQVAADLKKNGTDVFCTPNLGKLLKSMNLKKLEDELQILYDSGFGYKIKAYLKEFIKNNGTDIGELQALRIKAYLELEKALDGSRCVVTTHARFLNLPEKILRQYEIIIDEDILATIFKNTGAVNFQDLKKVMEYPILMEADRCRIQELMDMEDGSMGKTGLKKLSFKQLDKLYRLNIQLQSSFPDFMDSSSYRIDAVEERIDYFKAKKLPKVKMIIVSATINQKLYQDYCKGRMIHFFKVPLVHYRGNLKQYIMYSMSRSFIQQYGEEYINVSIDKVTGEPGINKITFKKYSEGKDIYYGKTEGFNCYQGKNLAIIGTPHNAPLVYYLIGEYLGYKTNDNLCRRNVDHNGYSFTIMTFGDEEMRNLQFYYLESELEQAIGRARLLRFDCTVFLFSNFPCKQAEIVQDNYLRERALKKN